MTWSRNRVFITQVMMLLLLAAKGPESWSLMQNDRDWKAETFQSTAEVTIETGSGKTATGIVFLTVKDRLAATAFHILNDARRVTLRFPNGEEFESTGLVDGDEKRNVALIRVRVFGKPLLPLKADEPSPGQTVHCCVIKDGAFGFVEASVVETMVEGGVKRIILAGNLPEGNNGSPVLDENGQVLGLLAEEIHEGQSRYVALSASYILALDHSLPTQPWGVDAPAAGEKTLPELEVETLRSIDILLAEYFIGLDDHRTLFYWANEKSRGQGYLLGVPKDVYSGQQNLEQRLRKLSKVKTDNPVRSAVIGAARDIGVKQYEAMEQFIKSIVIGQQMKNWGAQAQDMFKRSLALLETANKLLVERKNEIYQLYELSLDFRENLPRDVVYSMGLIERPSLFRIGITSYARNPFYLLVVPKDSFAYKLGFLAGDRIISVAGQVLDPKGSIEDLKMIIQENLGRTIKAIVERNDKQKTINLKIPREIPKEFLYAK